MAEPERMPQGFQIKRTAGWRMPPNSVRVSRPSKFDNPFAVGKAARSEFGSTVTAQNRGEAVEFYRRWLRYQRHLIEAARVELAGKDLGCWCPVDGQPCHRNVLLRVAAGGEP